MTDELALLESQAAAIDGQAAATEPGAAGPEVDVTPVDNAAEVAGLLKAVADLFIPLFPSLATVYTDETCAAIGAKAAPVLEKYDLNVGGLFGKYGEEIMLGAALFPVAVATVKGIRHDIDARNNPPPQPGAYAQERAGQDPNP